MNESRVRSRQDMSEEERLTKRARLETSCNTDFRESVINCSVSETDGLPVGISPQLLSDNDKSCASSSTPQQEMKSSPNNNSCIYKKQEYDEGFCFFMNEFPIHATMSETDRSAAVLHNTALPLVSAEKYDEAKKWCELASLRLKVNTSSLEASPVSVCVHHNLGCIHYKLGDNEAALECFRVALSHVQQISLGDMDEAAISNCIGVLCFHKEPAECEESLSHLENSLEIYKKMLPHDSTTVATVLNNIGRVHYLKGDFPSALTMYEKALALRRKQLGNQSLDVAATICNTGQTHHQLGNHGKAMNYYREFLQVAKANLGSSHRDIAIIIKCMAEIHYERKEMGKACVLYTEALNATRLTLGDNHPDLASTLNKLGNLHYEMNNLEIALGYYEEGFKIERRVLGPQHPHILVTLMNMAQVHRQRGDYRAALNHYTAVHACTVKVFGENSLETANTLSNMGQMQYQLKACDDAFELYQNALRIQRDYHGTDDHLDIASSLNSIGLILFQQGVHGLAKSCFFDSLLIRSKLLGPNHRDVAILWYNIATIFLERGDEAMAIKFYKETLRIERASLGRTHPDVVLTLQHLGLVHQRRGELEESLIYFRDALEIESKRDGADQLAAAKLLNLMGNIYLQTADVSKMNECFAKASRIYTENGQPQSSLVIAGYNFYGLSKLHPRCAPVA